VAPLVGVWVVLRRLAYLGDAVHASLAGVAASAATGIALTVGALGAGLLIAAVMASLPDHPRLSENTGIGVAEIAIFAAGLLLISAAGSGGGPQHMCSSAR